MIAAFALADRKEITVRMPQAPVKEYLPDASFDPDVFDIVEALTEFHFAGLCTLHGPPPEGVEVSRMVWLRPGDGAPAPLYQARLLPDAPLSSHAWVDAFAAGLDHWSDCGFPDPLKVLFPPGSPDAQLSLAPPHRVFHQAQQRLAAEGRQAEQLKLAAHIKRPPLPAPVAADFWPSL